LDLCSLIQWAQQRTAPFGKQVSDVGVDVDIPLHHSHIDLYVTELGPQQVSVSILIHSGRLASKINGIRLLVVFFLLFPFFGQSNSNWICSHQSIK